MTKHVLGISQAHVYTIELQTHGLPHAHILNILTDQEKPRDPIFEYDKIVCAEILDPNLQPRLHSIVKRCILHGPCGIAKSAPCLRDGKSSKKYQKALSTITKTAEDG